MRYEETHNKRANPGSFLVQFSVMTQQDMSGQRGYLVLNRQKPSRQLHIYPSIHPKIASDFSTW